MAIITILLKSGHQYIGEIEGTTIPFSHEKICLKQARQLHVVHVPVTLANGDIRIESRVIFVQINCANREHDVIRFSWEDLQCEMWSPPDEVFKRLYLQEIGPKVPSSTGQKRMSPVPEKQVPPASDANEEGLAGASRS